MNTKRDLINFIITNANISKRKHANISDEMMKKSKETLQRHYDFVNKSNNKIIDSRFSIYVLSGVTIAKQTSND